MKRNRAYVLSLVFVTAAMVMGGQYLAWGDSGEPAAKEKEEAYDIALLDVSRVFKEYQRFRERLEEIKKAVAVAESALREDAKKTRDLIAEAEALEPGEPLKKRLEDEVAERKLRIQLKMNEKKKDFMEQEAALYSTVYNEVETVVAEYSRVHGIRLVMRFNDQSVDKHSTREEILAGVNRDIVFQDGIDITDQIVKRINDTPAGGDL